MQIPIRERAPTRGTCTGLCSQSQFHFQVIQNIRTLMHWKKTSLSNARLNKTLKLRINTSIHLVDFLIYCEDLITYTDKSSKQNYLWARLIYNMSLLESLYTQQSRPMKMPYPIVRFLVGNSLHMKNSS